MSYFKNSVTGVSFEIYGSATAGLLFLFNNDISFDRVAVKRIATSR